MVKSKSTKPKSKPSQDKDKKKTDQPKKNKLGLILGLIGGGVLILFVIGFFVFRLPAVSPDDPKASLSYSPAFFVSNDGKQLLWNADGARLTEDEYIDYSSFIAGCAYVKKDDQSAVIRDDGRLPIPFGKYGKIEARGGLYLAEDGNTKENFLLTCDGRVLVSGSNLSLSSPNSSTAFALVESESGYLVFTYAGAQLIAVEKIDGVDAPVLRSSYDFGLFYYNNFNVVFDARTSKVIASFEGPEYAFEGTSENRTKQLLKAKTDDKNTYKLIANGSLYDLAEAENYALIDELVIGYNNDYDTIFLLDSNYKISKSISTFVAIKDLNNFAVKNENGAIDIIKGGQTVKTFEGEDVGVYSEVVLRDLYAIKTGNVYQFYRLDGSLAFDKNFANIWRSYDKHDHAIVADEEDKYYLIDLNGNRLTENTFSRIYSEKGGYEAKTEDGKYAILDLSGRQVTEAKYTSLYYRSTAVDHEIWTACYTYSDCDVYDLSAENNLLLEHVNPNSFYANYFAVKNSDGGYDFYTYAGLKFYSTQK